MTDGKRNKRLGSDVERYYAKIFRELGYSHCKTSRMGSKLHDNAGIDLLFVPFNIQLKAGKQKGLSISSELRYINDKMKESFPPESVDFTYPKILIHRKFVGKGKKREEYDDIVSMTFEDFKKIIER